MMLRATAILPVLLLSLLVLGPASLAQTPDTAGLVVDGVEVVGGELAIIAFLLNPLIDDAIVSGQNRTLLEIRELDDPQVQNDAFIEVAVYGGLDQDGNPGDDFSGSEPFDIDPLSLNPDGTPVVLFTPGDLVGGALSAGPGSFDLGGGIVIDNIMITGSVAPAGASFTSDVLSGAIPGAIFDQIPAPPPFPGTMLDVLFFLGAELDVDLDNDGVNDSFSVDVVITAVSCEIVHPILGTPFRRGDCNADAAIDISDAVALLSALFSGGTTPPCVDACDTNDDGGFDIADAVALLSALFIAGTPPPPAPYPDCGLDPTDDPLECGTPTGGC
ncbi:MAG: hypothetical protein ACE5GW_09435 [Planctomycetota bacterium]